MALPKREFVMLAHKYEPDKHNINGWFVSEKLDGQRALWLPETRDVPVSELPFANRAKDARDHIASGLWTRSAKPIFAPKWWLDALPNVPLDGELYTGRGDFSGLRSRVAKLEPIDGEWQDVRYFLFDAPSYEAIYRDGRIWSLHYKMEFAGLRPLEVPETPGGHVFPNVEHLFDYLEDLAGSNEHILPLPQLQLPMATAPCMAKLGDFYRNVVESGGEGVILRKYTTLWEPVRSHGLLKMKPVNDDEGTVVGFTLGKGKLSGLIGALILDWKGKTFELSGFTEAERAFKPNWSSKDFSDRFKIGDRITFSYRELTSGGVPKEARYLRPRVDGE